MVQTKEDGLTENGQMTLSSGVGQLLPQIGSGGLAVHVQPVNNS